MPPLSYSAAIRARPRKCEEAYRFIKQSYHLEDVRVRSYTALRNVYALVHAAFYHYAVADGIHRLLFASRTGPHPTPPPRPSGQLVLDFLKSHSA